jgi:hypothetical protein
MTNPIQYSVEYQFMPKGSTRPEDEGSVFDLIVGENHLALLPNIGDYVNRDNSADQNRRQKISGRVKSRAFFYTRLTPKDGEHSIGCHINIVLAETDPKEWGALIKE